MFLQKKNKRIKRFNQHQRSFKNPYFKNKKKEKINWSFFVNLIFYFSISVFTGILLYIFLYSSLFSVKDIEIVGNDAVSSYDIKGYYFNYLEENNTLFYSNKNILFLNRKALEDYIVANNNFVQSVEVLKNSRNKILIKIIEKEVAGYWKSGNDLYSFDTENKVINILNENGGLINTYQEKKEGRYYGSINMAVLAKYPMVIDFRYRNLLANDSLPLNKEKIQMIMLAFDFINKNDLFKISSFSFADDLYQNLIVKTLDGYVVYFSLLDQEELKLSLDRLNVLYNENLKNIDKSTLDYIDMRMSEKIFYK